MIKRTLLALSACMALPASAAWTLDNDASSLKFLTTKNAQITEVQSFSSLSGTLTENGQLTVMVPLDSVNTNIELRDTRMQEMLFETKDYPEAQFTADIPTKLMSQPVGTSTSASVDGLLRLHGVSIPASFEINVNRLSESLITASTTSPLLVKAADFKLEGGITALQNVAKLGSITTTVPVSFTVTFTQ